MPKPTKDKPVRLPGMKGFWRKPDRITVNKAGVPTYTWTLLIPQPKN